MVYKDKFVAVIKCRGKILRERNGYVTVPFGSDYSVYLKNLASRKAVVDVSVDGKDVLNRKQLILNPNETCNLEGFLKGKKVSHKFRFAKRTKQTDRVRGSRIDDGLVRVEYRFERKKVDRPVIRPIPVDPWPRRKCPWCGGSWYSCDCNHWDDNDTVWYTSNLSDSSIGSSGLSADSSTYSCNYMNASSTLKSSPKRSTKRLSSRTKGRAKAEDGFTVKGSKSNQSFQYGYVGELETQRHVIVLQIKGTSRRGKRVRKPVTVRTKLQCPTCGKKSRSSAKFCSRCSTALD